MATSPTRLLPLLVLLLLGAGSAGLWLLSRAGGTADPGSGLEGAPEIVRTAPTRVAPNEVDGVRSSGETSSPARLEVVVEAPDGRVLPDCTLELSDGESLPLGGVGGRLFPRLAAGPWTLRVTHPRYLEVVRVLDLGPGADERVVVRMSETVRVTGTVLDRFGSPLRGNFVYFLRPGETFPEDAFASRQRLGTQVDPSGRIALDLPAQVPLTLWVGFPGKPRYQVPGSTTLTAGGPDSVQLTVPGATRLRVEVEGLREEVLEGRTGFNVQVLQQRKGKRAERVQEEQRALAEEEARRKARLEERRRTRRAERRAAEGADDELPDLPDAAGDPAAAVEDPAGWEPTSLPAEDPEGLAWQVLQTQRYPTEGPLLIEGLPADKVLRLALVRKRERFESETTFQVAQDQEVRIRFANPPRRTEREEGLVPEPLFLTVQHAGPPAGSPPAGARWE